MRVRRLQRRLRAAGLAVTRILTCVGVGVPTLIASAAPLTPSDARADVPHIQVRGAQRIDVHPARASGKLTLVGAVVDDIGAPARGAHVALSLSVESGSEAPDAGHFEPCGGQSTSQTIRRDSSSTALVETDGDGRFCVRLAALAGRFVAHLSALPSTFLEGSSTDVLLDTARRPVTLRFDPEPTTLDLDGDLTTTTVLATTETDGEVSAAQGLLLRLANEADTWLAASITDSAGQARFRVPSSKLGPVGRGELHVSFAGDGLNSSSVHIARVERSTRVVLERATNESHARASDRRLETFDVDAIATCKIRGCSVLPTGLVETYSEENLLSVAPLVGGRVRVEPPARTRASNDEGQPTLRLHYVPDRRWFIGSGDLFVPQREAFPFPLGRALVALGGIVAVGWVVASRLTQNRSPATPSEPATGRPGLKVVHDRVRQASVGRASLIGRVIDAHRGEPIAKVQVRLERPGFEKGEILSHTSTDEEGRFELATSMLRAGDVIVAEAQAYRPLRWNVAKLQEVEIALAQRRRALLDELVAWARSRGDPFNARPEPTPGHVRRTAEGEAAVGAWAAAVEQAAFGGEIVDAAVEQRIQELAPAERIDGTRMRSV